MSKQKMLTASAMAALCALAALSLHAKAQDQVGQGGMVAVRDAKTGKMRAPTADELKALRAQTPAAASAAGAAKPKAQALAPRRDGARGVRLGEKTMVYEVITRGADGKLSSECLHGDGAATDSVDAASHPAHVQHKEHNYEAR